MNKLKKRFKYDKLGRGDFMKKIINDIKRANRDMPKSTKIIYTLLVVLALYMLINKLINSVEILVIIPVLILSIVLHEIAHGYVAFLNGDKTAKESGRLSLNPIKHIDTFGLLLPLFLILTNASFVIGWAKPVPVNYRRLKNQKSSVFMVSIAGIFVNLLLAFVGAVLYKYLSSDLMSNKYIYLAIMYLIKLNVTLAIFNILPIPPLDGSKIITAFGSYNLKLFLDKMEKYGFLIILVLLWTGILDFFMNPLYKLIYGLLNLFIGA